MFTGTHGSGSIVDGNGGVNLGGGLGFTLNEKTKDNASNPNPNGNPDDQLDVPPNAGKDENEQEE